MTSTTQSPDMVVFDPIAENPFTADAKVIADSVSPEGARVTTVQETFWRPVLAERNTHKNQYGNSSSSRAMSFETQLRRFIEEPADPTSWPAEQPGMQGGAELTGADLDDAKALWADMKSSIATKMLAYVAAHPEKRTRLHKSVLNRMLEVGQWHVRVTTATAWENFFDQRCDAEAQPEIRDVAVLIRDAMAASTPRPLAEGDWHLPYVSDAEIAATRDASGAPDWALLARVSAARCARTSYETMDGVRDLDVDLSLFQRLVDNQMAAGATIHWSPLEHVATPDPGNRQGAPLTFTGLDGQTHQFATTHLPKVGALTGWRNLRTEIEALHQVITFR